MGSRGGLRLRRGRSPCVGGPTGSWVGGELLRSPRGPRRGAAAYTRVCVFKVTFGGRGGARWSSRRGSGRRRGPPCRPELADRAAIPPEGARGGRNEIAIAMEFIE
nr:MAG TPA: hypothetical protein [Genomoviridae sp.]